METENRILPEPDQNRTGRNYLTPLEIVVGDPNLLNRLSPTDRVRALVATSRREADEVPDEAQIVDLDVYKDRREESGL
jgi:hypothetical protein